MLAPRESQSPLTIMLKVATLQQNLMHLQPGLSVTFFCTTSDQFFLNIKDDQSNAWMLFDRLCYCLWQLCPASSNTLRTNLWLNWLDGSLGILESMDATYSNAMSLMLLWMVFDRSKDKTSWKWDKASTKYFNIPKNEAETDILRACAALNWMAPD